MIQMFQNYLRNSKSRTAKLWSIGSKWNIMKLVITAERMGNYALDMYCVRKILPPLHARSHIAYARSAHLYLQTMDDIKTNMNLAEYTKLTRNDLFTIRRSDK